MNKVETRLQEMGITLPVPAKPVASYVPFVITGDLVFISGQISVAGDGTKITGILGETMSVEDGQKAAMWCMVHVLSQLKVAAGDFSRVARCIKLGGFIASTPTFTQHPQVMNGASDLLVRVMDEEGHHARAAVGVPSLPLGVAVEVDAIFALRG